MLLDYYKICPKHKLNHTCMYMYKFCDMCVCVCVCVRACAIM